MSDSLWAPPAGWRFARGGIRWTSCTSWDSTSTREQPAGGTVRRPGRECGMTGADNELWGAALDDLANVAATSRAMGGEERLREAPRRGQARRPRPHRAPARPGIVPGARHARRRRGGAGRRDRDGLGPHRRPPGDGRGRGLHREGRHDQLGRRTRSATASPRSRSIDRVPLIMMLEGAGFRADGAVTARRTPTDMLAQARCSGRVPLVTAVLGASAGHGALVAPMSDFTVMSAARVDLHRRPAGRVRVARRDDHQGRPRRSRRSRSRAG